jgi:hypothetical protein
MQALSGRSQVAAAASPGDVFRRGGGACAAASTAGPTPRRAAAASARVVPRRYTIPCTVTPTTAAAAARASRPEPLQAISGASTDTVETATVTPSPLLGQSYPNKGQLHPYKDGSGSPAQGGLDTVAPSQLIGNTPLLDLSSYSLNPSVKILAKCEYVNPSGSIKDRIAQHIITRAMATGKLRGGMTVVAATSGNTGAAIAMTCALKGRALHEIPFSASYKPYKPQRV